MSKKTRPAPPSRKPTSPTSSKAARASDTITPSETEPESVEIVEAEPPPPPIKEDHSDTYDRIEYRTKAVRDQKARVWLLIEEGDLTIEGTISLQRARDLHAQLGEAIDLDRHPLHMDDYKPSSPEEALPDPLVQEGVKAATIAIHPQGMLRVTSRWGLDQAKRLVRGLQAWIEKKESGIKQFHHVERTRGVAPRPASALTPIDPSKIKPL